MNLYDDFDRTDHSYAGHAEPHYAFYNRVALPRFKKIREMLEVWFGHYPEGEDKSDLKGRFISDDDVQHYSALFELALHEMLLRLGCKLEIHPDLNNGTGKRPDFLVKHPSGNFYLEAVVVPDESTAEASKRKLLGEAFDAVNGIESRDFVLSLIVEGSPKSPINKKDLKNQVQKYLKNLNYDELVGAPPDYVFSGERPSFNYSHDGVYLTFNPIPKTGSWRLSPPQGLIGGWSGPGGMVATQNSIKKALNSKAKRYGKMDLPFVVATNVMSMSTDWAVPEALYGSQGMVFQVGSPGSGRMTRMTDGVWRNRDGTPRHTNLCGVLVFGNLIEANACVASLLLHLHPKADQPYKSVLNKLKRFVPTEEGVVTLVDGIGLADILGQKRTCNLFNWVLNLMTKNDGLRKDL